MADHGANGPEVVLAVGVAPSRRWAQQWHGLVVGVAWRVPALSPPGWLSILRPSYTLEVFAARRSAQTPRGVSSVTGDAATHKSAPSREYRDGHDTTSSRGGNGDSPSSGAAGKHLAARWTSVARTRPYKTTRRRAGTSGSRTGTSAALPELGRLLYPSDLSDSSSGQMAGCQRQVVKWPAASDIYMFERKPRIVVLIAPLIARWQKKN